MELDERWLQRRFPAHQVTCGLAVTNQTPHRMNLIETYLHFGAVDESFPVPRAVEPGAQTIIVAKNSRAAAGASGLTLWRLGDTHYHCILMWSAPRNFYLHANTVALGITPGKPAAIDSRGYSALFSDMCYYDGKVAGASTFYAKVSCHYGEEVREGSFANNRFQIGARLGQEHRHWATVCVSGVSPVATEPEWSTGVRSYEQAKVILATHSYQSSWRRRAATEEEEKCHVALLVLTKKRSVYGGGRIDSVWICELTGREGGKRDVSLRENAVARCDEIGSTASGILLERKSLGIKTYNMGLIQVDTDDLVSRGKECPSTVSDVPNVSALTSLQEYAAKTIGVDMEGATDFSDRNMRWIQCLAARLNVGDQDVIPLARESVARAVSQGNHLDDPYMVAGADFGLTGLASGGLTWPSTMVSNEKLSSMECDLEVN